GAEHLVGLAGSGAGTGMAFAHWELHSYMIIVLGWVFAPFYLRSRVFTTPEFLEKRYTPGTRTALSLIFLAAYVLTKASVTIYAGAITIKTILGYDSIEVPLLGTLDFFWFSAFALVIVTGVYTVVGGMKAVLWTEGLQAPLLLIGSIVILLVGLHEVGGLDALRAANADTISLWRPLHQAGGTSWVPTDLSFLFDSSETPWLGVVLGSPIIGVWYWCTDQYIVQRVLTARNLPQARRGAIWAGYLKLFPVFIFLIPGMIAVALKHMGVEGFADMQRPDEAFPRLAAHLLPVGLRGLVLAGMLAALMSSLASLFNSTATLFTVDFYEKLRPNSSEAHLVTVGRIATVIVVFAGLAWIPIMQRIGGGQLYGYLQNVQSLLAPAIAAVFMLGIFSKRVSPISGLVGIVCGFFVGMARLFMQVAHEIGGAEFGALQWFVDINWLYFCFLLFAFTCVLILAVSAFTPKATDEHLEGLTYGTISPRQKAELHAGVTTWDVVGSAGVIAIVAAIYIYFW
ncbi:MAG TPA: sodium:solute symporter, partial [Gammaproteobacteria bacterium]|nr:sodium:solute symporter [Gammaproteobacteria bacterium]